MLRRLPGHKDKSSLASLPWLAGVQGSASLGLNPCDRFMHTFDDHGWFIAEYIRHSTSSVIAHFGRTCYFAGIIESMHEPAIGAHSTTQMKMLPNEDGGLFFVPKSFTLQEKRTYFPVPCLRSSCVLIVGGVYVSNPTNFITGLHHLTACVGAAQEDVDFYTKIIGLRIVKQTVLLDGEKPVYHLYYANETGTPGTKHHARGLCKTDPSS